MAKAPKFGSDVDFAKHVAQPGQIAHKGADYFYVKGGFITYSAGSGDAGKPIKLDADGKIDSSMMPAPELHAASHEVGGSDELSGEMGFGSVQWATDEYAGAVIPSDGDAVTFGIATVSSATTGNDYIAIARIELSGNYSGGWIQLKGMEGAVNREANPVELDVQFATEGTGTLVAPVITSRGRFDLCDFRVYTEVDGGGSGIHYCTIYYRTSGSWQSLKAEIRARMSTGTNCEMTVWQTGNNVGESIPTGTLYRTNDWWAVYDEFRTYSDDTLYYGRIYATSDGLFIKSVNDPLYLNHETAQNIYAFANITSGNPELKWFGWDSGASAVKYGYVNVSSDGSTWLAGEEYLRLVALGNYVDILPNNASYGMIIRKHDSAGVSGSPYVNFFVEDATVDYLNIVLGQTGANLGLVIDDNDNVGVGKVATAGYKIDANGIIRGTRLYSTVAIGTAPLTVTSTTKVTNLNADLLDGYHSSAFPQMVYKTTPANVAITADTTWRDLTLTTQTSSDATWVYLYLRVMAQRETHESRLVVCPYNLNIVWAECRMYGGSLIAYTANPSSGGRTYNDMCVWVPLDSSQRISYYGTVTAFGYIGDITPHILVIGYIEEK